MINPMFRWRNTATSSRRFYSILVCLGLLMATTQSVCYADDFNKPYKISHIAPDMCSPYDGMIVCGRKIENQALRSTRREILRVNDSLCLPISENGRRCFKDKVKTSGSLASYSYAFVGSFVNSYYLVLEILDEDWNLLMISTTDGQEIRLLSYPVLNPSKNAFAVASFDIDAGYRPNIVQIWSVPPRERPVIEISKFPDSQGPCRIAWLSDTKLQVALANLEGESGDQMLLQAVSSGWSVHTIDRGRKQGNSNTTIE